MVEMLLRNARTALARWSLALAGAAAALTLAGGCASNTQLGQWAGPDAAIASQAAPWKFGDRPAQILVTQHYRIHTTIQDEEVLAALPQLLEGAMHRYKEMTPGLAVSDKPLDCFVFRTRTEWEAYTRKYTGPDATVYLQIVAGGYAYSDKFVAYYIGRSETFSVTAHEGWHQYCGRNFKGRLPPFLEEGIACMFEQVNWYKSLPRWNTAVNPHRVDSLKKAIDTNALWPLEKLISTHAGDIVGERMDKISAFYAQSWAFARFLWEGENGKYRPAMQKWLTETAQGTVYDPSHSHIRAGLPWNRRAVKPMIEHYVGTDLKTLETEYLAYIKRIAREDYRGQSMATITE